MNGLKCVSILLPTLKSGELVWTFFDEEKKNDDYSNVKRLTATIKFKKGSQQLETLIWARVFLLYLNVYIYPTK